MFLALTTQDWLLATGLALGALTWWVAFRMAR